MAQLRDKSTSQVLYEGTPLECVTISRQLGADKVLFDGVGLAFDDEVVWKDYQEKLGALQGVIDSGDIDQEGKDQAGRSLQDLKQEVVTAQARTSDVEARQAAILAGDQVSPLS